LGRDGADTAQYPMHEHGLAVHRSVGEDGAMGGDAWDPEACADLIRDFAGQVDCLVIGYDA